MIVRQRGVDPPHAPPLSRGPKLVQDRHAALLRSAPPGLKPTARPEAPVRLEPDQEPPDDPHPHSHLGWGSAAVLVSAGVASLVCPARAAAAQSLPMERLATQATPSEKPIQTVQTTQDPPLAPLRLDLQRFPTDSTGGLRNEDGVRVSMSQQNDSMPGWLEWVPAHNRDRMPGVRQFDDNGWTAEVKLDYTRTQGNDQWTGGFRYSMLTQRGSWEPTPEYRGLRTDLVELAVQKNERLPLSDNLSLIYGVGGGVQAVGPMGGHWVQEQFHIHGGFGGRVGDSLQREFSTEHATYAPMLTAGVGLERALGDNLTARGTLQGAAVLGPGLNTLRAEASLQYRPFERLMVEGGVNLNGVYSTHRALDFMGPNGVRPGAFVGADYRLTRHVHTFARVQTGGIQDEPVYYIGLSFGTGGRAWLNPLF